MNSDLFYSYILLLVADDFADKFKYCTFFLSLLYHRLNVQTIIILRIKNILKFIK